MPHHQSPCSSGQTGAEARASGSGLPSLGQCMYDSPSGFPDFTVTVCHRGLTRLCLSVAVPRRLSGGGRNPVLLAVSDGHILPATESQAHPARVSRTLGTNSCFSQTQIDL